MNRTPDPGDPGARDHESGTRFEDYLDHLCAPLIGIVPYDERQAFRIESLEHLSGLCTEYRDLGLRDEEARETALREFGDPERIGREFARAWRARAVQQVTLPRTQTPMACAFGCFGAASVASLLVFERQAALPIDGSAGILLGWVVGASPILAGLVLGAVSPAPAGRAMLRVQCYFALLTLLMGFTLMPHIYLLELSVCQLVWWLPAGWASTRLSSSLAARLRRPRSWRRSRRFAL